MNTLDNQKIFRQIDEQDLYGSFAKIGRQFDSGWTAAQFVGLDFEIDKIKNIVFVGMGASNLAGYIAESLSPFLLTVPFQVVSNYRLPSYADKSTLVILSSYSGDTEEVLSCAQDAEMRSCKHIFVTSDGKLLSLAKSKGLPIVLLDSKLNPSNAPRAGIGLSLGAVFGLLIRLNPSSQQYFKQKEIVHTIDRVLDMTNVFKPQADNPAKSLAAKHRGQGVLLFSANHLAGVGKLASNYINETSKTFSNSFNFPDLNHHLLEGFSFPLGLKEQANLIILNSSLYPEVIQKRVKLTRDILLQQKYLVTVIKPETTDAVSQVFESLVFLIMFSYYLSIANKVNPAPNPWVDYLKAHL